MTDDTHRRPSAHLDDTQDALRRFAELFVQRWDTYARPRERSRDYFRARRRDGTAIPLTPRTLIHHLRGELTVGLYSVDLAGTTKWSAFDSDRGLDPLLDAQRELARRRIASYLERSRAGGHLWVFWSTPLRPDDARKILSPSIGALELFLAGDIPDEDGLGLAMRAPLGVHRYTGERYPFVGADLLPVAAGLVRGQIDWLYRNIERVNPEPMLAQIPEEPATETPQAGARNRSKDHSLIAEWVARHDIREVVGRYVQLSRSGIGRCPWPERHKHGDGHPSFAVFDSTQRWWCFTERIGGNAFDFLCRYRNVDAARLLREPKS